MLVCHLKLSDRSGFSGFMDVCPSGFLDRDSIQDMYAMPRKNAEIFIDQMFILFDRDGDGNISFKVYFAVYWPELSPRT